jgi:phosphate-selective porin OprO/OprP
MGLNGVLTQGIAMHHSLKTALLAGAALIAATPPAFAAADQDGKLGALERQVQDLNQQIGALKQAQSAAADDAASAAAVADLKRSTSDQYADLNNQIAALPKVSVDNGRLTVTSGDGRFSAALRGTFQYDTADYSQSKAATALPAAYGPDLGSGANFRRVYLGLSGRLFADWSYNLNFDFGGSGGTETPGRIQSAYLSFDALAPWSFRIGAYPPPASIEDGTGASDTLFLERNAPSDLQRNIAGGDGRNAVSLIYADPTVFGALSYTGNKVQDGAKALAAAGATAAPNFDEQQGLVGRLSWLPINTPEFRWLVGVNGTIVLKLPDLTANGASTLATTAATTPKNSITLSANPELTVDSNGVTLANTGALPAKHVSQWGIETAFTLPSLYGQAGYYGFQVARAPVAYTQFTASGVSAPTVVQPSGNNFSGWYAQAAWTPTGESRAYNQATGAFTPPKPAHPFALDGSGWGAFELAARYSDIDLNDRILDPASVITAWSGSSRTFTYYNTVRGGDQRIATLGLNWYPNNAIRFALNYELIQNSRLQSSALPTGITTTTTATPSIPAVNGGQNVQAVSLRAQLSF